LNKGSAWNINHALASRLGVIEFVRVGEMHEHAGDFKEW
jgi:hypothetical protein